MDTIQLFNSDGKTLSVFRPINPGQVGMYCCGPTVYSFAHIGNLRTFIFEDLLKRTLMFAGYKVKHIMNITDVGHLVGDGEKGEDKLSVAANKEHKTVYEIAKFYTDQFFSDLKELNILPADVNPKASEHIKEMIVLIQRLIDKKCAYLSGGNVYFSIDSFPKYGQMAGFDLNENKAGQRIEVDKNKKNPLDFALWFTDGKFKNQAMQWESPWGVGYPGWHIECSAMSMKYLGEQFDIHCGGIDAIKVHHTNEIAQSEAATGKKWVNYWLHGEFLVNNDGAKMSKSSGEFLTLQSLKSKGYEPLVYRFFCLNTHYRKQLNFSFEAISDAKRGYDTLLKKISALTLQLKSNEIDDIIANCLKYNIDNEYLTSFKESIYKDLNMPKALGILQSLIKDKNINIKDKLYTIAKMDSVFGLNLLKNKIENKNENIEIPNEIAELFKKRCDYKNKKDWTNADNIRNELLQKGWIIVDTNQGSTLKRKND